jgi:hypothetical protein
MVNIEDLININNCICIYDDCEHLFYIYNYNVNNIKPLNDIYIIKNVYILLIYT